MAQEQIVAELVSDVVAEATSGEPRDDCHGVGEPVDCAQDSLLWWPRRDTLPYAAPLLRDRLDGECLPTLYLADNERGVEGPGCGASPQVYRLQDGLFLLGGKGGIDNEGALEESRGGLL